MDDHYHVSFSPLDLIIYSDICLIAGNKSKFAYHLCITWIVGMISLIVEEMC